MQVTFMPANHSARTSFVNTNKNQVQNVVLTNKKRLPVENKLKKYQADNFKLFANEDLANYASKADFIQEYMAKNNFKQSFLIEDSIDNLNKCKKYQNIIPLLVNWGYVSPKEKGLKEKEVVEFILKGEEVNE